MGREPSSLIVRIQFSPRITGQELGGRGGFRTYTDWPTTGYSPVPYRLGVPPLLGKDHRYRCMVWAVGFEPTTSRFQSAISGLAELRPEMEDGRGSIFMMARSIYDSHNARQDAQAECDAIDLQRGDKIQLSRASVLLRRSGNEKGKGSNATLQIHPDVRVDHAFACAAVGRRRCGGARRYRSGTGMEAREACGTHRSR